MKNTDIAMIILIATISVVLSYFLGNAILGDPNDRVEKVSYMETIDSGIEEPDPETFNPSALNPTVEVYVGNCGPLEVWNTAKYICVSKDELGKSDDENDEDEADSEKRTTDESAATDAGDASTETSSDDSLAGDE
jgi:hypothetical protein